LTSTVAMAPARSKYALLGGALAAAAYWRGTVFVPPPAAKTVQVAPVSTTAACVAALAGAGSNAHADAIGDAAARLTTAAYPFMKEVPWSSSLYGVNPGSKDAVTWAKAIGKMIEMGAEMDYKLLKAGADAHHAAIQGLPASGNPVCTESQLTAINAAIGRLIASVPESTTMGVYDAVSAAVDPEVPPYLMSLVKAQDAKNAYGALVDFASVVKANPITPGTPTSTVSETKASGISAAAEKLSDAAYPLMKEVDWTSDLFSKPIPGKTAQEMVKAVDKMIVMGSAMDGAALKEAALAHAKAIQNMDARGVLTQEDFVAINAGLGKAIASVPTAKVMDVYNTLAKTLGSTPVPNYLFSQVNPNDAQAAYNALLEFKDVVKAAR